MVGSNQEIFSRLYLARRGFWTEKTTDLGLLVGMYAFMLRLFWVAQVSPTPGTVALYAFAGLLLIIINTLYWPQLVLFRQTTLARMRNIILFTAKYLWKMVKVSLLQVLYIAFSCCSRPGR